MFAIAWTILGLMFVAGGFLAWCCGRVAAQADEAFERYQIDFGALEGDLSAFVEEQNARAAE